MRATNMTKSISIARLLLAPTLALFLAAAAHAAVPGIYRPDLQPDGADRFPQPAGRQCGLLLGLRVSTGSADRLCPGGHHERYLPDDAGSRPDADCHGRTDGHGQPDEWSSHGRRQHLDSVSRLQS